MSAVYEVLAVMEMGAKFGIFSAVALIPILFVVQRFYK